MSATPVSDFLTHHYRHFNAAALVDAAEGYRAHVDAGGKMLVSLAGAMSTAELGLSLAEMIRRGLVDIISCTGANLEEDLFNLVAHDHYERIPRWRDLTPADEEALLERGMNRVTDTCIPEEEAFRRLERALVDEWTRMEREGERLFPHQVLYRLIRSGRLQQHYQIDPKDSWLVAAAERDLPVVTPGWEDSTTGNIFAAHVLAGDVGSPHLVKHGIEFMTWLADWYTDNAGAAGSEGVGSGIGFFQIGGGIAGDFPICVVPMLEQDMDRRTPLWSYFCQISDSTTSYGSYSGAVPNEKITWGKLSADTPSFLIESDATIVAPLVFQYVLERSTKRV
jgi:deoxyhypusine synthase